MDESVEVSVRRCQEEVIPFCFTSRTNRNNTLSPRTKLIPFPHVSLSLAALSDTDFSAVLVVAYYEIDMAEAVVSYICIDILHRENCFTLKHVMYINILQNVRARTSDHSILGCREKIFHIYMDLY